MIDPRCALPAIAPRCSTGIDRCSTYPRSCTLHRFSLEISIKLRMAVVQLPSFSSYLTGVIKSVAIAPVEHRHEADYVLSGVEIFRPKSAFSVYCGFRTFGKSIDQYFTRLLKNLRSVVGRQSFHITLQIILQQVMSNFDCLETIMPIGNLVILVECCVPSYQCSEDTAGDIHQPSAPHLWRHHTRSGTENCTKPGGAGGRNHSLERDAQMNNNAPLISTATMIKWK